MCVESVETELKNYVGFRFRSDSLAQRLRAPAGVKFASEFFIDAAHELAMLIWNDGRGHKLTAAPYLCLRQFAQPQQPQQRPGDSGCDATVMPRRSGGGPASPIAGTDTSDLAADDRRPHRCVVYGRHDDDDDDEREDQYARSDATRLVSSLRKCARARACPRKVGATRALQKIRLCGPEAAGKVFKRKSGINVGVGGRSRDRTTINYNQYLFKIDCESGLLWKKGGWGQGLWGGGHGK